MPLSGRLNEAWQCLKDCATGGCRCFTDWARTWARSLGDFLKEVWQHTVDDQLPMAAGAISFFLIFSIIPLLGLAFSAATFVLEKSGYLLTSLSQIITQYLGLKATSLLTSDIFTFVKVRGVLTGIALVVALWTGGQVFTIMEQAMNRIWHAERHRTFIQSRLLGFGMLLLSMLIIFIAVVLSYVMNILEAANIPLWGHQIRDIHFLPTFISVFVPFVLTTLMFGTIYRILPLRRITWQSALPGAIFSAVVWMTFLRVYGFYALILNKYSFIYGALGNLVLVMILFYYSSLIMLIGAEIASVYHRRLMEAGDIKEQRAEEAGERSV